MPKASWAPPSGCLILEDKDASLFDWRQIPGIICDGPDSETREDWENRTSQNNLLYQKTRLAHNRLCVQLADKRKNPTKCKQQHAVSSLTHDSNLAQK
jgi:hypothetical protein